MIRGFYITYKQSNKYYRGRNLTVNDGQAESYIISSLHPYTEYQIEIQAFTRAGVSPVLKNTNAVLTHEDGMFHGRKRCNLKWVNRVFIDFSLKSLGEVLELTKTHQGASLASSSVAQASQVYHNSIYQRLNERAPCFITFTVGFLPEQGTRRTLVHS